MADDVTVTDAAAQAAGTNPDQNSPLLAPVDPATPELAPGAAEAATPTTQDTGLTSGMKIITTPQGKASVDVHAPDFVVNAFDNEAAATSPALPLFDESGKRIVGTTGLRQNPKYQAKGSYVVTSAMVTTSEGKSYVTGDFIPAKDLGDSDRDLFLDNGSVAIYGGK